MIMMMIMNKSGAKRLFRRKGRLVSSIRCAKVVVVMVVVVVVVVVVMVNLYVLQRTSRLKHAPACGANPIGKHILPNVEKDILKKVD